MTSRQTTFAIILVDLTSSSLLDPYAGFYPEIFPRGCEPDSGVSHGRGPKGREREVGFLGQPAARESGERCKLPQRSLGQSPRKF